MKPTRKKLDEVEKIMQKFANSPFMSFPEMRRRIRALVRKAYKVGWPTATEADCEGRFKELFGVKP